MAETSSFESVKVTAKGLKLLTKVHAGETLRFTRAVIGDGYMADGQNSVNLTNIINEIPSHQTGEEASTATVDLTRYDMIDEGVLTLRVKIRNGDTEFYLRELGVMAEDPDDGEILYAYVNFGDNASVMPAFDGNTYISRSIDLAFTISNTVNIDANITFPAEVSYEEFELHRNASVLDHPDGSVTTPKIAKYAIDTEQIARHAVTEEKLSSEISSKLNSMSSDIERMNGKLSALTHGCDIMQIEYTIINGGSAFEASVLLRLNGVVKYNARTLGASYPATGERTYLGLSYNYDDDRVAVDMVNSVSGRFPNGMGASDVWGFRFTEAKNGQGEIFVLRGSDGYAQRYSNIE